MSYYAGYHRSRIEVMQYDRQQLIALIEYLYSIDEEDGYLLNSVGVSINVLRLQALIQHRQEWTIPNHYLHLHPDAEDEAVYFKVGEDWLIVAKSGQWVLGYGCRIGNGPQPSFSTPTTDTETQSIIRQVAEGQCRPDILADYLDERFSDNPTATQIAGLLRVCEPVGVDSIG